MKNFKAYVVLVLLSLTMMSSKCDGGYEEEPYTPYPVAFYIKPLDANGNSLFGSGKLTQANIDFIRNTTVTYNDSVYTCDAVPSNKSMESGFTGLSMYASCHGHEDLAENTIYDNVFYFGKFMIREGENKFEITVTWPDGTKDVMSYSRSFRFGDPNENCYRDPSVILLNDVIVNKTEIFRVFK